MRKPKRYQKITVKAWLKSLCSLFRLGGAAGALLHYVTLSPIGKNEWAPVSSSIPYRSSYAMAAACVAAGHEMGKLVSRS